jgi:hypothetical protein
VEQRFGWGTSGYTDASIAMAASRFFKPRAAATGYENIRDHCAYIRHLPNKRFAQINSNRSRASTSDKRRVVVTT